MLTVVMMCCYFALGRGTVCSDEYVSLFVCPLAYLKNYMAKLPQFFYESLTVAVA